MDIIGMSSNLSIRSPKRPVKTALHQAIVDGRLHQVRLLVSVHKCNVDSRDMNGRTPMMISCILDNEEVGLKMAKICLKAGAFLNAKDIFGRSALSYACMKGKHEIVRRILREDIMGVNDKDNDGNTPLIHAATSGKPAVVKLVVDILNRYGLPIDIRNNLGYTALLLAAKHGHYVSAHILLKEGGAASKLRDNEYFLNASEWARRSYELRASAIKLHAQKNQILHRPHTQPSSSSPRGDTRLPREHDMYRRNYTPICRHVKAVHDLSSFYDSSIRLPTIFAGNYGDQSESREEALLDGQDARKVFLDTVEVLEQQRQTNVIGSSNESSQASEASNASHRPVSTRTAFTTFTRGATRQGNPHPSTAKLLAFTKRSHTQMRPDLSTLFKLYSDQYYFSLPQPEEEQQGEIVFRDPGISIEIAAPGEFTPAVTPRGSMVVTKS
ncbi:ankyrin repeat domain-containing protein 27 [Lingula anatina]|uniref:Ankyrin repeat domain-containing protein 27 n=1 Tax=Lingula anatina TaxID=7574 RepID=A0A1S3JTT2_LINAN|nr:ankyrin repeat domain-containing protein 27 [Lingula anatina]|eukprot:XP_013413506.1 ankyrin repeat domain-containing protein 27 [Lingula anatina]